MTRHNTFNRAILLSFALAAAFAATGCDFIISSGGGTLSGINLTVSSADVVTKVPFDGAKTTVTLTGLNNSSVYLVKQNNSSSTVAAGNSGSALYVADSGRAAVSSETASSGALCDSAGNPVSGVFETPNGKVIRYDHKASMDFSAAPPIAPSTVLASRASNARDAVSTATDEPGTVNSTTKTVYVEGTGASGDVSIGGYYWRQLTVTLRAKSDYASVWVATDYDAQLSSASTSTYDDLITHEDALSIANTFTSLYPVETAVFGYEYGGGPSGTGGKDGKKPVDIILYDISFDDESDPVTNGGIVGYFWGKDWYPKTDYEYSNVGEIFYIDTLFAKKESGVMYSTLAHEFQHMIDWNVKNVTNEKTPNTWYNEMLSQVAEDMLSSYLTTYASGYTASSDGPIAGRMPTFNGNYYASGVTDWLSGDNVLYSYATSYAFGAYLARNYGGAALIHEMASNPYVNTSSVSAALSAVGASETSFAAAFARYPEALLCSTSSNTASTLAQTNTFDRSDTHTVNGYTYMFPAFDILDYSFKYTDPSSGVQRTFYGPLVASLSSDIAIRPYGSFIQTTSAWQNKTGSLTITLNKPADSNISLYLVERGR